MTKCPPMGCVLHCIFEVWEEEAGFRQGHARSCVVGQDTALVSGKRGPGGGGGGGRIKKREEMVKIYFILKLTFSRVFDYQNAKIKCSDFLKFTKSGSHEK